MSTLCGFDTILAILNEIYERSHESDLNLPDIVSCPQQFADQVDPFDFALGLCLRVLPVSAFIAGLDFNLEDNYYDMMFGCPKGTLNCHAI